MRRLAPGSTAWLIAHELRLGWRAASGTRWARMRLTRAALAAVAAICTGIGLAIAWPVVIYDPAPDERIRELMGYGLSWLIPISAMQSLIGAKAALNAPETELLLTSPLQLRRVLVARTATMALGVASAWPLVLVAIPFVNGLAILGRPAVLMAYPMLLAVAVAVGSIAFAVMLAVIAACGRVVGSAITTILAVGLLLLMIPGVTNQLPTGTLQWLDRPQQLYTFLTQGMTGAIVPFAVTIVASVAITYACAWACEGQYRRITVQFLTPPPAQIPQGTSRIAFRHGTGTVLWLKEVRMLWRRPAWLVGQLSLLAVMALSVRGVAINPANGLGGLLFIMTVGLGSFARAAVLACVESDGPADLLLTAPAPLRVSRAAKIGAAGLFIGVFAAVQLAGLAWIAPRALPVLLFAGTGVAGCALWLALREPGPAGWHDLAGTRAQMSGTRVLAWVCNGCFAFLAMGLAKLVVR